MPGDPVSFGPFVLFPDNGTLFRDGKLVPVGHRAVMLLGALLKSPGRVFTKAELMDMAWPGTAVEESNLSVQIASLRKMLGPAPDGGEWIATVPRVGYRFIGEAAPKRPLTVPIEPVIPSLAVLPFQNLGSDPEQDFFADGVVEDIITALSRFKSFAVIARNSSFIYKGRVVDVRQVAGELGVRYVLEGSVQRAGTRLRIRAQLVDGETGADLWARNFDGSAKDIFDFQDGITESVATVVEPRIQRAELERARRDRPESLAAYDRYLNALPVWLATTPQANAEAYGYIRDAIALEPTNPTYLAMGAFILQQCSVLGFPPRDEDDRDRCLDFIERALAETRDDASVLAFCGLCLVQFIKDYDRGLALIRRAVEANPNNLLIVSCAGVAGLHLADVEEALGYFHRAIRLSPLDPSAHWTLTGIAHAHMILGNYRDAIDWASQSLAVNSSYSPTYWMLIAANALLGDMTEAHRLLRVFRRIAPEVSIASIRSGQPGKDSSRIGSILDGLRLAGLKES